MAKSLAESHALFDRYILAEPEPVISKLGNESALRMHILSSISGGYVHDVNSMFDFISHTFLAHQKQTPNLIELISDIFDFLHREKFIEKSGFHYFPTTFGSYTSRLCIDPISAIILREGLKKIEAGKSFSNIGLLHMICCCPDNTLLKVGKNDYENLEMFASNSFNEFIFTQNELEAFDDLYTYLSSLKTTWMLLRWTEEEKEEIICDEFNIGPGDIYRHVEATRWLLYAAGMIAELFKFKKMTFILENLRNRVRYGIKEELLELSNLKGIGRIRARSLYQKGFKHLSDFNHMTIEDLAKTSQIGKSLAKDILEQVTNGKLSARTKFQESRSAR